jgi:DNA-binding transcriptional ArsR family regulator
MSSVAIPNSKNVIFERVSAIAALMGSPARLKILLLLAQSPRSVEDISVQTGESVANTSQHLKKLRDGGLLECTKNGLSRVYRLQDERTAIFVEYLFDLHELTRPEQTAAFLAGEDGEWSELSPGDLRKSLDARKAVLLDVRDEFESAATPVEDALRIPMSELKANLGRLAKSKIYYVLCRGRACGGASDGVRLLRESGFKAFRIKESPSSLRLGRVTFVQDSRQELRKKGR